MPSLSETLRASSPFGYSPAPERPSAPASVVLPSKAAGNFGANPSIRCPLPPFNIGPDTLRQFDQSEGVSPKRRVIPLPVQSQIGTGGSTTIINTSSSSGGGGGSTAALTAKTVTYTSPLLPPGASDLQVLTTAKSYQLIGATSTAICEMRLYGSSLAQAADVGRATDAPLPAELLNGLVTDVVFDTAPLLWAWQNRVGVNADVPQDALTFITVFNIDVVPAQIQITILYLPLES